MDIRLLAEKMYEHWSRKLLANVLLYCAIIGGAITYIYPKLESFNLAGLSKLGYGLTVILLCPFLVLVYALFVKSRNKISSVRHLLDIFPTYASVVRLLAAFLIAFWAIFQPGLRALAATYIMIVLLAGILSFFPVYYDLTFRFIRVVIDVVLATLVYVHFGGINSPFVLLYFLPVTIAARYFDPAPSRLVAILAVLLFLVFTFLDFHNPEHFWVENASQYIPQFGVISVLIFLVGELIYAERRERIIPVYKSLVKLNDFCQENKPIEDLLNELVRLLNCEAVIALRSDGAYTASYNPLGTHSCHKVEGEATKEVRDSLYRWVNSLDLASVSTYWDILNSTRRSIVDQSNITVKPLLDESYIRVIYSFLFARLGKTGGLLLAINNKSANKIVIKPFTHDRFELLEMASTVIDDHPYFRNV